jgi:serine/threonine protein kinase
MATCDTSLCRTSGAHYAVKVFRLRGRLTKAKLAELKQEVDVMKMLDHPNIIRLQEVSHYACSTLLRYYYRSKVCVFYTVASMYRHMLHLYAPQMFHMCLFSILV